MARFKLPSFSYLREQAVKSFLRFPLVLLSALMVAVFGIVLIDYDIKLDKTYYLCLMLTSALGVPLFFAIHCYLESITADKIIAGISYLFGFSVLFIIYLVLPKNETDQGVSTPYVIYFTISLAVHLIISFAPFLRKNVTNGFWQFNRLLFVQLFIAQLYAIVLYGGISGALLAIEALFEFELMDNLFGYLWVIHASLVNIWIFISDIDEDVNALNENYEYPKALKIFAQYILLPIVALYFIILYVYIFKVLIQWDWPKGIVSYLVIGVSALTYLTSLLIFPYYKLPKHSWINPLRKGLFIAVIPLTIILFVAIGMRINDYGLTINRYIILVVGIWLLLISIYNAIFTGRIKTIPISLAVVAILICFGPWGVVSVSERNQVKRLKTILLNEGILSMETGKLVKEFKYGTYAPFFESEANFSISDSVFYQSESILEYLDDYHDFDKIESWFHQDIDSITRSLKTQNKSIGYSEIQNMIGLKTYSSMVNKEEYTMHNFRVEDGAVLDVNAYDNLFHQYFSGSKFKSRGYGVNEFEIKGKKYEFYINQETKQFILSDDLDNSVIKIDLDNMLKSLEEDKNNTFDQRPYEDLTVIGSNESIDLSIVFTELRYNKDNHKIISDINGAITLLFNLK